MFSRRPRKKAPPRQRPQSARRKPARKRAGKRARSKGKTRRAGARGRRRAGRRHSPLFAFIFWPFLIINRLLAKWPGVVRIPTKGICYLACGASSIFILAALLYFLRSLSYDMGQVAVMPQRSIIYDRNMKELGRLHGAHRYVVDLAEVSPHFRRALLAREDKNFYDHHGVDPRGVARSIVQNIKRRAFAQGASTLTMQLARNAFRLPTRGPKWKQLDRKFLELALALRIERAYGKDEIMQHYMNLIFWGGSIHGVEAASRAYLEKSAGDLTLSEAAMLAGIIRGPNAFSPFDDVENTKKERNSTLDSMVDHGFITDLEAKSAKDEPLHIRPENRRIIEGSYAMDAIRRDIERHLDKKYIKQGGLKIITTIDKDLQEAAERHLNSKLSEIERRPGYRHNTRSNWQSTPSGQREDPDYLQGAIVAVENRTGAIRCVVGGRDADESKFNRAIHARRQIGSVFKPFVYLAAFDQGMRPDSYVDDSRIKPGEIRYAPRDWDPRNSSGKYLPTVTARQALMESRNTSSVRIGDFAGMENVCSLAHRSFAITVPSKASSYLGSWEATPEQVASAYTIFPNAGTRYGPHFVSKILDSDGKELWAHKPLGYEAVDRKGAAWTTSCILEDTTRSGTAASMRRQLGFQRPAGGKTGTTDGYQDAWFVGYSSGMTCAVWVGLDQPRSIMEGGYGADLALPIWVKVMKTADRLGRYEFESMKAPVEMKTVRLCRSSGKHATPGCEHAQTAYDDTIPIDLEPRATDFCPRHPLRAIPVK